MLNNAKYKEYSERKMKCPYGRVAIVGSTRCLNCIFNKLDSNTCSGNLEDVYKHRAKLHLDY